MPTRQLPPELLQEIRDLAADAAAARLAEGTLAYLLEQAECLGTTAACPDCGNCCPVAREPRTWQRPGGSVTQNEPVAHCPACRRDFFPSTPSSPPQ